MASQKNRQPLVNSSQTLDLVRVAVPVPLRRHFDYLSPARLPRLPGRDPVRPQTLVGLVVDHPTDSQVPRNKLKPIKRVLDSAPVLGAGHSGADGLERRLLPASAGEVLPHALPVLVRRGARRLSGAGFWFATEAGMAIDLNELKRAAKAAAGPRLAQGPQTPSALKQEEIQAQPSPRWEEGTAGEALAGPSHDGDWATRFPSRVRGCASAASRRWRSPPSPARATSSVPSCWTASRARQDRGLPQHPSSPLLKAGKQALVMVPEIGLTPRPSTAFAAASTCPWWR